MVSVYKAFTFLGKFLSRYFTILNAIVNLVLISFQITYCYCSEAQLVVCVAVGLIPCNFASLVLTVYSGHGWTLYIFYVQSRVTCK